MGLPANASPRKPRYDVQDGGAMKNFDVLSSGTVLVEHGRAALQANRRYVTDRLIVQIKAGADPDSVAATVGGVVIEEPSYAPGYVIIRVPSATNALDAADTLGSNPDVISASPLLERERNQRWVPQDSLFPAQWHLRNVGNLGAIPGIDIKATDAWDLASGDGITIGIVDVGIQGTHPDLIGAIDNSLAKDWVGKPLSSGEYHGTAVAGLIGARANGIGVVGVAFDSMLAPLRLIGGSVSDFEESQAMAYRNDVIQVKNNSWGSPDDGLTLEGFGPLGKLAVEDGAKNGRGGKGTIYVWAGGNGRGVLDNANYDGYANDRHVIAVGAIGDWGLQASYSELGANLLCCAPSWTAWRWGIVTTDLLSGTAGLNVNRSVFDFPDRDYTAWFGGTSASAPLVSGIVALMLEKNPNLTWRDVQEILIRSATKNHPQDYDWITNGAGIPFNHKYGAGMVNAAKAVTLSSTWANLGPELCISRERRNLGMLIWDASFIGARANFVINAPGFRAEHVAVTVDIDHSRRGDLETFLISPSGMMSRLSEMSFAYGSFKNWQFSTVHHWGESVSGTWTVLTWDRRLGYWGVLNSVKLDIYGTSPQAPLLSAAGSAMVGEQNASNGADPGELVSMRFDLLNTGGTSTTGLIGSLVPTPDIVPTSGTVSFGTVASGTTTSGTFSFRAAPGACGQTRTAHLHLQDGAIDLGTVDFPVLMGTGTTLTFTRANPTKIIDIPSYGIASEYPSQIVVSGITGVVTNVRVKIGGFYHECPNNVDVMVVSPAGKGALLMSDCGGQSKVANLNLSFDDNSPFSLPLFGMLASGTFQPTGDLTLDPFVYAWPPYANATLASFKGANPNGIWNLYIFDDELFNTGHVENWSLEIEVANCTAVP